MPIIIFLIVALIMSAIFHECAHGYAAYRLGDPTAKLAGRLTLNPIPHLDPIGSVILPIIFLISNSPIFFAWAKPVPYNPNNLTDKEYGELKVAIAGPISNLILAVSFGLIARFMPISYILKQTLVMNFFSGEYSEMLFNMQGNIFASFFAMSILIVFINLALMIFNLLPIPPLDGSKVLMTFLPFEWQLKFRRLEMYGFLFILLFLMSGLSQFIWVVLVALFRFIVGV